jgi:phosphate transport system ATP-binding protein
MPMSDGTMPSKIETRDLVFYYGPARALKKVNIACAANRVTAIIGPSGCGKSTFIRTLNRMNDVIPGTRMEGKILLDGKDIPPGKTVTFEVKYEPDVPRSSIECEARLVGALGK